MDDDSQQSAGTLTRLADWAKHPFRSDMSALDWVLFLGLTMVATFLWSRVLAALANEG